MFHERYPYQASHDRGNGAPGNGGVVHCANELPMVCMPRSPYTWQDVMDGGHECADRHTVLFALPQLPDREGDTVTPAFVEQFLGLREVPDEEKKRRLKDIVHHATTFINETLALQGTDLAIGTSLGKSHARSALDTIPQTVGGIAAVFEEYYNASGNAQETAVHRTRALGFIKALDLVQHLEQCEVVKARNNIGLTFEDIIKQDAPGDIKGLVDVNMLQSASLAQPGGCLKEEMPFIMQSAGGHHTHTLCFRVKSMESYMLKAIGKYNGKRSWDAIVREATKDAVGARVVVDTVEVGAVLQRVAAFFAAKENLLAEKVITIKVQGNVLAVEDVKAVLPEDVQVEDRRKERAQKEHNLRFVIDADTNNAISSGYKVVKLLFRAQTHANKPFGVEFMIEPDGARNEAGLRNHSVYDCAKKLRAISTLYGTIPTAAFAKLLRQASRESGLDAKNIAEYLLGGSGGSSIITKASLRGDDSVFISRSVAALLAKEYERFHGRGGRALARQYHGASNRRLSGLVVGKDAEKLLKHGNGK